MLNAVFEKLFCGSCVAKISCPGPSLLGHEEAVQDLGQCQIRKCPVCSGMKFMYMMSSSMCHRFDVKTGDAKLFHAFNLICSNCSLVLNFIGNRVVESEEGGCDENNNS